MWNTKVYEYIFEFNASELHELIVVIIANVTIQNSSLKIDISQDIKCGGEHFFKAIL